jgi:hypothetical protein
MWAHDVKLLIRLEKLLVIATEQTDKHVFIVVVAEAE